jgi:hypothetical protein
MTLGGTPSTALLRAVSMSLGWTGQLAVGRGGTGTSNLTGVVIGNNTSAMTSVTGTALQIFRVNSAGSGYEFFTATFLSNPMTTPGDIIFGGVLGSPARLGANTTPTNMFLRSVSSGAPSWEPITSADITGASLTRTNDTNVTLTLGGSPSTALLNAASLTLGWSGTLAVGRGGSGASTLTGVLVGNGTSAFTAVVGTAGQFLRRNLANTAYEFRTLQGGDIAGSELTFANDTNVIMTLGGSPGSALLQPVSINLGWTGQLAVSRGGTGASTLTGVLIGNGTSAVTAITGTANQILRRNSGNTAYEFWSANYLVNPMTLEGSIIYATTGGTPTELFANNTSTNKYLRSVNGGTPSWEEVTGFLTGSGITNYIAKWTPSGVVLGNSQLYDNGTNVGVGTIVPEAKLHVYDSGDARFTLGQTGVNAKQTLFIQKTTGSGYLYIQAVHQAVAYTPIALNPDGGNVGIGTATPSAKLEIAGGSLRLPNLQQIEWGGSTNSIDGSNSTNTLRFWTNNVARVTINNLGNVGIGIASATEKLSVEGSISINYLNASANYYLYLNRKTGQDGGILFQRDNSNDWQQNVDSSGNLYYYAYGLGTAITFEKSTGYLGIGVATPVSHLDVFGSINLRSTYNITWGGAYGTDIPTISGTSGSGSNGFLQFYPAGSTSGVKMALRRTGQLALTSYTSSSAFTGTSVATLAVDAAGDVITIAPQQTTASGTYTPTWTGLANVDSVTSFTSQYMRVGDTVTVSGWVTINATADNTPTSLSFSLPINSDTSVVNRLNGTGVAQGGGAAACLSGYGSNFGEFEVLPSVDTAINYSFHFTYRII